MLLQYCHSAFQYYFSIGRVLPNTTLVLPQCFPILLQDWLSASNTALFKCCFSIAQVFPNTTLVLPQCFPIRLQYSAVLPILLQSCHSAIKYYFSIGRCFPILLQYCPRVPNTTLVLPQCFPILLQYFCRVPNTKVALGKFLMILNPGGREGNPFPKTKNVGPAQVFDLFSNKKANKLGSGPNPCLKKNEGLIQIPEFYFQKVSLPPPRARNPESLAKYYFSIGRPGAIVKQYWEKLGQY